jgi:hypothetical protein
MKIIIRKTDGILGMREEEIDTNRVLSVEIVIDGIAYQVSEVDGALDIRTGRHSLLVAPAASNAVRVRVE